MKIKRVLALSAGHFINDSYQGFLAPLLPLLIAKLGFSLTLAGVLTSISAIATSLIQPVFGHIADKTSRTYWTFLGPLVTAFFLGLIGLATHYWMLVIIITMAGIGTAAFHPQAAVLTGQASEDKKGLGMAIFVTGGSAGHSFGPLIVLPIVTAWGLQATPITMIWGIVIALILWRILPKRLETKIPHVHLQDAKPLAKRGVLLLLWYVGMIRAFMVVGFVTFIPLYLTQKNTSLLLAGTAITVFELSGAAGSFIGGPLSDRLGRKFTIAGTIMTSIPFLWLFLYQDGIIALVCLAIAGFFLFSSIRVVIITAQELFPNRASTASSLMMGVSWGVGGLLVTPLGALGETYGLQTALSILVILGISSALAALFLPKHT